MIGSSCRWDAALKEVTKGVGEIGMYGKTRADEAQGEASLLWMVACTVVSHAW